MQLCLMCLLTENLVIVCELLQVRMAKASRQGSVMRYGHGTFSYGAS